MVKSEQVKDPMHHQMPDVIQQGNAAFASLAHHRLVGKSDIAELLDRWTAGGGNRTGRKRKHVGRFVLASKLRIERTDLRVRQERHGDVRSLIWRSQTVRLATSAIGVTRRLDDGHLQA